VTMDLNTEAMRNARYNCFIYRKKWRLRDGKTHGDLGSHIKFEMFVRDRSHAVNPASFGSWKWRTCEFGTARHDMVLTQNIRKEWHIENRREKRG
jgi:hypothetical protein